MINYRPLADERIGREYDLPRGSGVRGISGDIGFRGYSIGQGVEGRSLYSPVSYRSEDSLATGDYASSVRGGGGSLGDMPAIPVSSLGK